MRIDRRRKLPATTLLYALGLDQEGILDYFYSKIAFKQRQGRQLDDAASIRAGCAMPSPIIDWKNAKTRRSPGRSRAPRSPSARCARWQEDGVKSVAMPDDELVGRYSALDMVNVETGEIYVEAGDELTLESIARLREAGFKEIVTSSMSITSTSAPISATPWRWTRTTAASRR